MVIFSTSKKDVAYYVRVYLQVIHPVKNANAGPGIFVTDFEYDINGNCTFDGFSINDGATGYVYYFCINNFKDYKKKKFDTLRRGYKVPKLKCR